MSRSSALLVAIVLAIGPCLATTSCGGSSSAHGAPADAAADAIASDADGSGGSGPSDAARSSDAPGNPSPEGGAGDGGGGSDASAAVLRSTGSPRLFFSDLESGPKSGGQGGMGAFVTVWGNGFGATQGASTITVGGGAVAGYPVWTATTITFQLGSGAATGNIVVHVPGKADSNGLPFTVRAGNLYFVTSAGNDASAGGFASPWKTIAHAKDSLAAGDVAYLGTSAGDMLSQTGNANYNASLSVDLNDGTNEGTAAMPKALVAYPGARVTIGDVSNVERGLLVPAITGTFDYWVIAGLNLRGAVEALDFEGTANGWRVVGNDISCPNGTGKSGCVVGGDGTTPSGLKFYGNVVHDAAANVTSVTKYYHGVYLAADDLDLGWNVVRDGKTCRAIQFHDSTGPNLFGLHVHDNLIFGTVCDGINFATVDPSQGTVEAYNNVIYQVGRGPDPADGSSDYAGIYVANITNAGSPGSGNVHLYNNTLYDCGSRGTSAAGAIARAAGPVGIQADDNLVLAVSGESFFSGDGSAVTGKSNLFFGSSDALPAALTGTIPISPMLVSPATFDFHLQPGSPAIDHGIATPAATDYDGTPRPQGAAFDVGAYEWAP
ncbi:MAG TPA: choice-of-anchor Q domain-containing protein [Polyangiaceae bacterium]|nr:choice-of-anchor Q domain-containing protein [Polyangiaceae bacterium]